MRALAKEAESRLRAGNAAVRRAIERLQAENEELRKQITQLSVDLAAAVSSRSKQVPPW